MTTTSLPCEVDLRLDWDYEPPPPKPPGATNHIAIEAAARDLVSACEKVLASDWRHMVQTGHMGATYFGIPLRLQAGVSSGRVVYQVWP